MVIKKLDLTRPKKIERLTKAERADLAFDLINAFSLVRNPLTTSLLLQDLLTAAEIKNLSKRLRIAKLILSGKKQEEIIDDLHCSFATISKVRQWLDEGGAGFRQTIEKLPKKTKPFKLERSYLGYGFPQLLAWGYLSHVNDQEKKRVENLLNNAQKKKIIFDDIQKFADEEFRNIHKRKRSKKYR